MSRNQSHDFEVERYKYILNEIRTLNENFYKYLTLFQTLSTALIGGGISLFAIGRNLNIAPNIVVAGIRSVVGLLILLTLFILFSIISSMASWLDYRREEVEILNNAVGKGFRQLPKLNNFWRWHETYLILFIIAFTTLIYLYTEYQLIPLIK